MCTHAYATWMPWILCPRSSPTYERGPRGDDGGYPPRPWHQLPETSNFDDPIDDPIYDPIYDPNKIIPMPKKIIQTSFKDPNSPKIQKKSLVRILKHPEFSKRFTAAKMIVWLFGGRIAGQGATRESFCRTVFSGKTLCCKLFCTVITISFKKSCKEGKSCFFSCKQKLSSLKSSGKMMKHRQSFIVPWLTQMRSLEPTARRNSPVVQSWGEPTRCLLGYESWNLRRETYGRWNVWCLRFFVWELFSFSIPSVFTFGCRPWNACSMTP